MHIKAISQLHRESAHKEKKKAEDRQKIAVDAQQQSLQRAMDAEVDNPVLCVVNVVIVMAMYVSDVCVIKYFGSICLSYSVINRLI